MEQSGIDLALDQVVLRAARTALAAVRSSLQLVRMMTGTPGAAPDTCL